MKRMLCFALLFVITIGLTACQGEDNVPEKKDSTVEENVLKEEVVEKFELTQEGKKFLENLCYYLPDFQKSSDMNEEFWHTFIFLSYTGASREDVEAVNERKDNSDFPGPEVKVSKEIVKEYVKLALGVELPVYEPSMESMEEGQTAYYYKDGYYYIGASDFPDISYRYKECTSSEDNTILAEYIISFEDVEDAGSVFFNLSEADNTNGFVVSGKNTEYIKTEDEITDGEEASQNYYEVCTNISKKEVEAFADKVKQQVLSKDWEGLSKEISYPIVIGEVTYNNEEEFVAGNFDSVLSQDFIDGVESESCKDMFCNWQGVMFGTGQIWISEVLNEDLSSQGLKVIALNGMVQ